VVAVREHGGRRAAAAGDGVDDRQRVEDVARDYLVRVSRQPALGEVRAVRVGAVGQQDDCEAERARGGQESLIDGGSGNMGQKVESLHDVCLSPRDW
jgi:hypothetical protein